MDITRRMINLSWGNLLHWIEGGENRWVRLQNLKADFATLDERQQKVLTLRWGLGDGMGRSLEVVGCALGVTRERIRQIEAKALRKLREGRCSSCDQKMEERL